MSWITITMIIHQPEIITQNGEVTVKARIEPTKPIENIPKQLWFTYPEQYANVVTERGDAFAASLLTFAMFLDEDLEIHGEVSPQLAFGLQDYQHIYQAWYPKILKLINIRCDQIKALNVSNEVDQQALAFSGGVDSHFTLWSLLPKNQVNPYIHITHGLFIHGFDIRLHQNENYNFFAKIYSNTFSKLGLDLIRVRTNVYRFYEFRIKWEYINGGPTVGCGLVLEKMLRKFFIGSSYPYPFVPPLGSSPLSDHWLSTETMKVIHFGAVKSRLEKLEILSAWQIPQQELRVCINSELQPGQFNCSSCDKCIRTMSILELMGSLSKFSVFKGPANAGKILSWCCVVKDCLTTKRIFREMIQRKRFELAFPMLLVLVVLTLKSFLKAQVLTRLPNGFVYRLKKRVYQNIAEKAPLQ
jgi:hypothetical protein